MGTDFWVGTAWADLFAVAADRAACRTQAAPELQPGLEARKMPSARFGKPALPMRPTQRPGAGASA